MKKTLSLLLLSVCAVVRADVRVTASDESGETVMLMNREAVRINLGGANQSILFNAAADAFQHLNHDEQSYVEFDSEMIQELSSAMDAAMSQMKAAMAGMPKEQQEMMAKLLGSSSLDQSSDPEPVITETGSGEALDGVPCKTYRVTVAGKKVSELWVASYEDLKMSPADAEGFQKLTVFQEKMMDSFKNNPLAKKSMKAGMAMFSTIDGFPLRVKTYDQGVMVNDFEVLSLVTVKGRAADYVIPPGYRKQDIPALHGDGDGGLFPTRAP